jgi:hypothetical protein
LNTSTGYPVVDRVSKLRITGNIIPSSWYSQVVMKGGLKKNGEKSKDKTDAIAILVLAEIVYWYRSCEEKDEVTGQVLRYKKKFHADKLQKSYGGFSEKFGFTVSQIRGAVDRLVSSGIITRELRNIPEDKPTMFNVMYLEPVLSKLEEITYGDLDSIENQTPLLCTADPSAVGSIPSAVYSRPLCCVQQTNTKNTNTKTTTKTCTTADAKNTASDVEVPHQSKAPTTENPAVGPAILALQKRAEQYEKSGTGRVPSEAETEREAYGGKRKKKTAKDMTEGERQRSVHVEEIRQLHRYFQDAVSTKFGEKNNIKDAIVPLGKTFRHLEDVLRSVSWRIDIAKEMVDVLVLDWGAICASSKMAAGYGSPNAYLLITLKDSLITAVSTGLGIIHGSTHRVSPYSEMKSEKERQLNPGMSAGHLL